MIGAGALFLVFRFALSYEDVNSLPAASSNLGNNAPAVHVARAGGETFPEAEHAESAVEHQEYAGHA